MGIHVCVHVRTCVYIEYIHVHVMNKNYRFIKIFIASLQFFAKETTSCWLDCSVSHPFNSMYMYVLSFIFNTAPRCMKERHKKEER